jgi:hypothetical protein
VLDVLQVEYRPVPEGALGKGVDSRRLPKSYM